MASLNVLSFDAEGRAVDFEVWLDDLQLFLQCDSKDGLSLFDLTSGASTASTPDADSTVHSQWLTRDAAARLAVCNHLPSTERAHFSQYKSARALYDAVVARYSSPTTAALSRLMLAYLFPDLAAFATVADLVAHLRTSDARYRAALPTEDHFLSLCPTELTVDLLEERLAAAKKGILAVGASHGDRRTPFFEGCSHVPLLPSVASAAAVDLIGTEEVGANPPPMYITLYYLVTRLPNSLSSVRDHFLSLCPTELTVDLLEERLAAAKKGILAVGASHGDRRTPFFEGCSHVPLLPSVASAAAVDLIGTEEVGAVSAPSGRRRTGKGKGSKGGGGGSGGSGGEVEVVVGVVPGVGASVAAVAAVEAVAEAVEAAAAVVEVAKKVVLVVVQPRSVEALLAASVSSSCTPVRPRLFNSFVSGTRSGEVCGLPHTTQRCFGRLTDAWRTQLPDAVELPRWHDLLLQNVPIFDLDFDAILAAMYAFADITKGDSNMRVPPDPGTVAAALGASAAAALGASASAAPGAGTSPLSGTAPTESFHTFTLHSGASRSFFRDSTTLTPLSRPVAVSLADASGGPVLAHSSTVLPCPAAPSGLLSGLHLPSFSTNLVSGADLQDAWIDKFTPGGHRVTHCTCSRMGSHLATFTHRPGSSLLCQSTTVARSSHSHSTYKPAQLLEFCGVVLEHVTNQHRSST
ncbi:unnamed protein product [Closterium sp. NIES-53]